MHEIKRVADESMRGPEDGQRAHRGDKQIKSSQLCQSLIFHPVRMSNLHATPFPFEFDLATFYLPEYLHTKTAVKIFCHA